MHASKRHGRVWRVLCRLLHRYLERKFCYRYEKNFPDKPCLVISNHVTNWDPLLIAISFPRHFMHFVASEHIFRWGLLSRLISYLVAPIPRAKGASGTETAMACIQKIREGGSVCLFAEGEVTWNGISQPVFPGTGMLAKGCGATVITYRLEGGALSLPRWAKTIRKGGMEGRVVHVYTPDMLKSMSVQEITDAIQQDIHTDALKRCQSSPKAYPGKRLAEHLECALFLCPQCKRIGGLHSHGDFISCACGLSLRYTDTASFDPPHPFQNFRQWDDWQMDCLQKGDFLHQDSTLFSDDQVILAEILPSHKTRAVLTGLLELDQEGCMRCGEARIYLHEVSHMAIVQADKLFFTIGDRYYELRPKKGPINFRKYLAAWQCIKKKDGEKQYGLFSRQSNVMESDD
ncbi:MAG: 1-acyl-sn-glycerol-3-phosphate acyltransferase [Clostridiales bacterium]|nr:1-acyl-sn-glycerol-3-phosphate acyltransferase [Clostridiales bacterium]